MTLRVALPLLAVAVLVPAIAAPAADPAVASCADAYLQLEGSFARLSFRLARLLCTPDRFEARAAELVRTTNQQIAAFNDTYAGQACDPDVPRPVPAKTTADVRQLVQGYLKAVPLDRYCNGTADPLELCGNGVEDPGEACDGGDLDGQTCASLGAGTGTLACAPDCESFDLSGCSGAPRCGDGITQPERGEACDKGGQTASCDYDCTVPACGDGLVNAAAGEQCDDANLNDGDACTNGCRVAYCGNGHREAGRGEQCDTGGPSASCDYDCTLVACGDGITNRAAGEECDDGNGNNGDGCSPTCRFEVGG